jgi:hypothetical protein
MPKLGVCIDRVIPRSLAEAALLARQRERASAEELAMPRSNLWKNGRVLRIRPSSARESDLYRWSESGVCTLGIEYCGSRNPRFDTFRSIVVRFGCAWPPSSVMSRSSQVSRAVSRRILTLRGERVLLSPDLALLYQVEPRALLQAVQRNRSRFPVDFIFRLEIAEWENLKSQFVISSWGGGRSLPYAFTEQGVAMLSGVLRSARAVAVNVEIMRAFVQMRRMVVEHADLAARLDRLEKDYDVKFKVVFDAIRQLMLPPSESPRERIGYRGG